MVNRADQVLALLPTDEDLPRALAELSAAEQAWRGRLFAIAGFSTGTRGTPGPSP